MDHHEDRLNHPLRETQEMRVPPEGHAGRSDRTDAERADRGVRETESDASSTPGASNLAGEAAGGIGGTVAGAALGTLIAGPVGAAVGVIAGAVGGWWAGRAATDKNELYTEADDEYYRGRYESLPDRPADRGFDEVRPAYCLGHYAACNPDYSGRSFEEVEADLQRGWTDDLSSRYGEWGTMRGHAREAYLDRRENRHDSALRDSDRTRAAEARERVRDRMSSALDGLRRDDTVGY